MSKRPRSQAVPADAAGSRPRRPRLAPRESRGGPGRGFTLVIGIGLFLIIIGLGAVVAGLPNGPQPTPAAGPLPIAFGLDLDKDTYLVTQPTSSFEIGDGFAYSVNPTTNPGVPQVYVSIITFRAGTEVVLQDPTAQRLLPEPASFGYKTTTNDMIELFGYGRFTMKIYLDPAGAVYAQGRFEIVEPSVPQQ
jgi:hypothetical protein